MQNNGTPAIHGREDVRGPPQSVGLILPLGAICSIWVAR